MTKFVVTFGPDHAQRFRLPGNKGYVEVIAASMTAAREVAFKWLGDQWCNLYAADEARVPVELREIDVVGVNADQIISYRKDDWQGGGDAA